MNNAKSRAIEKKTGNEIKRNDENISIEEKNAQWLTISNTPFRIKKNWRLANSWKTERYCITRALRDCRNVVVRVFRSRERWGGLYVKCHWFKLDWRRGALQLFRIRNRNPLEKGRRHLFLCAYWRNPWRYWITRKRRRNITILNVTFLRFVSSSSRKLRDDLQRPSTATSVRRT